MVLLLYQESMRLELLEVHQSAEEAVARNNESVRADLQRIQEVSNLELVCTKSTLARANAGGGIHIYIYILGIFLDGSRFHCVSMVVLLFSSIFCFPPNAGTMIWRIAITLGDCLCGFIR